MPRYVNPTPQYLDDAGDPLISGKLYFFESGTNTPKATFADINLSIPNPHPVILTASGRTPNIFFDGTTRMVLTNADDIQIWVRDPVGGDNIGANFEEWNQFVIYSSNSIVQGSDGKYYSSFTDGNEGNDPAASNPEFWQEIEFINVWNTNVTYQAGATVKASDSNFYKGLTADNQGNDPISSPTEWGVPFEAVATVVSGDAITIDASDAENPIANLDITKQATVTPALGDFFTIADISNANAIKKVNVQAILDMAPQGDVVGPATATDNAIARYDGVTGELIQDSATTMDDDGSIIPAGFMGSKLGTTIANSATPTIPVDGDYFTDANTVTCISVTVAANRLFSIKPSVAKTYTASASIVTIDGADLVLEANQVVTFFSPSTNVIQVVAVGSAGGGGGFTSETAQATTSGTEILFNGEGSILPSGISFIVIDLAGVSFTAAAGLRFTLADAGGHETAGYEGLQGVNTTTFSWNNISSYFVLKEGAASTYDGHIIMSLLDAATNTWTFGSRTKGNSETESVGIGQKSLSGELTEIRMFNGTFNGGKANIKYM